MRNQSPQSPRQARAAHPLQDQVQQEGRQMDKGAEPRIHGRRHPPQRPRTAGGPGRADWLRGGEAGGPLGGRRPGPAADDDDRNRLLRRYACSGGDRNDRQVRQ